MRILHIYMEAGYAAAVCFRFPLQQSSFSIIISLNTGRVRGVLIKSNYSGDFKLWDHWDVYCNMDDDIKHAPVTLCKVRETFPPVKEEDDSLYVYCIYVLTGHIFIDSNKITHLLWAHI